MKTIRAFFLAALVAACGSFSDDADIQGATDTLEQATFVDDPSDFSRPATLSNYRLGVGDRIALRVFNNSALNVERDIDAEGQIEVGFIGEVMVMGRTVTEVREEITQRLNDEYLVDPQVSFDVLQYRPIFVLGQVAIPGDYPSVPV